MIVLRMISGCRGPRRDPWGLACEKPMRRRVGGRVWAGLLIGAQGYSGDVSTLHHGEQTRGAPVSDELAAAPPQKGKPLHVYVGFMPKMTALYWPMSKKGRGNKTKCWILTLNVNVVSFNRDCGHWPNLKLNHKCNHEDQN